ncbi:MAG TPA: HigA family addiction module antitoxin [Ktedonobacteraceae bacterium]|nr:HigA family addiction module antitoxin [Ktedonobacteraceae bacterium]
MANIAQNEYHPDDVSPPGETLLETLETIGMSQAELAKRMGRPVKTINEIIQKKAAITAETALQLEQVLRIPASFWLKREQHYRESLARLAEEQRLESWVEWLKEIPIRIMIRRGWIPACTGKSQQVLEALKFFGVASPEAWQAIWESKVIAYRKAAVLKSNFGAVATWLRQGELEAQKIECAPYNAEAFHDVLIRIRALTVEPVNFFQRELVYLCANAGVAVVFVQELPNTGICGSTQWLTPVKALVHLSLRYKTDDQLWFTFFHEAGHILRHGKRQIFLEMDQKDREEDEDEANAFASNILINRTQWQRFIAHDSYRTKVGIKEFARQIGIAPGIVVGRLQHENLLPYGHCNELKRYLEWNIEEVHDAIIGR